MLNNGHNKPPTPKPEIRPLLPKSNAPVQLVPSLPTQQLFETDDEYLSFKHYSTQTANELAGYFDLSLWNRLVLQASHDQPFIRHAIITIGALSQGVKSAVGQREESLHGHPQSFETQQRFTRNHEFALQHYDRFLAGSRMALSNGHQSIRMAMIICLLIICIESLQWHHHSALKYVRSGMNLLDEWLSDKPQNQEVLPGISSPAPEVIEDEILQQFRILDVDGAAFFDFRPREYHERVSREGVSTVQSMPTIFTSVHEARLYLELIIRRTHHFIAAARAEKRTSKLRSNGFKIEANRKLAAKFGKYTKDEVTTPDSSNQGYSNDCDMLESQPRFPSPTGFEQEIYASENRRWNEAFEPLFYSLQPADRDFFSAKILKIRSNVLPILLTGELSTSELVYDAFYPEFEEIVSLASAFFHHPSSAKLIPAGSCNANSGLIFPLRLTAEKCRDRRLRREAIELLLSRQWREASWWWSSSTAQIGQWLISVEEDGVETDYIPEWARARLSGLHYTEEGGVRKSNVECIRGVGEQREVKVARWNWTFTAGKGIPRSYRVAI